MAGEYLESDTDAELIRRASSGHEASIKSLGLLNYLGAFFGVFGTVMMLVLGLGLIPYKNPTGPPPEIMRPIFLGLSLVYLAMTFLNAGMGYGLRRLQVWARWTTVVLTVLGLLASESASSSWPSSPYGNAIAGLVVLLIGSLIPGYILYLMVSAKVEAWSSRPNIAW